MKRRIIAVVLAGILMGQGMAGEISVMAAKGIDNSMEMAEGEAQEEQEKEEIKTEDVEELTEVVLQQQKDQGCFTEVKERKVLSEESQPSFETCTLLVSALGAFDAQGARTIINGGEGFYVLLFDTQEETRQAFEVLEGQASEESSVIQSVAVDEITYVADTGDILPAAKRQSTEEKTEKKDSRLRQYIREHESAREVKVAVIDTGWEKGLTKVLGVENRILDIGWNLSASGMEGDIQDDNGHGTRLVRMILEETGENVKIMPIKAADTYGRATILSVYLSIQAAMEQGAEILLLSMNGTTGSGGLLAEAVKQARGQGIAVVVSAGNYRGDVKNSMPADLSDALVVSAVENESFAEYSNYGETVDFCANGSYEGVDGRGAAIEGHGTSYAAARVAAAAASLRTFLPDCEALEAAFVEYAQDFGEQGFDPYYGHGYLGPYLASCVGGGTKDSAPSSSESEKGAQEKEETEKEGQEESEREKQEETEREGQEKGEREEEGKQESGENERDAERNDHEGETENGGNEEGGLAVQDSYYVSTTGYFFVEIAYKNSRMKYKVTCSVPEEYYYGSQELTQSKKRIEGTGDQLLTKIIDGEISSDGVEGWDENDRMYVLTSTIGFKEIPGYHLELDCDLDTLVMARWCRFDGYQCKLRQSTNSVGMTNWYDGTYKFYHNTYKLKYVPNTYTVAYHGNGADSGSNPSETAEIGEELTVKGNPYRKLGYHLAGYALVRKSDGKVYCGSEGWRPYDKNIRELWKLYQPGKTLSLGKTWLNKGYIDDTFTFYAQWEANAYTISYNSNGTATGSISSHKVTIGKEFTLKANGYRREGHQFLGYTVVRKSDNKIYCTKKGWQPLEKSDTKDWQYYQPKDVNTMDDSWINMAKGDEDDTFQFYAQWKKKTYTVTYHANGGASVSKKKAKVAYGDLIDLSVTAVPKDSRDTFIGWGTDPKDKTALFSGKMGAEDITLYALYSIPVSDVKEVYLKVIDKTGKKSRNGKQCEIYSLTKKRSVDTPVRGYYYRLNRLDYKERFPNSKSSDMAAAIFAVDHAGNISRLKVYNGTDIQPERVYGQVVVHLFQNLDKGKDVYEEIGSYLAYEGTEKEELRSTRSTEQVREGLSYTPKALAAPLPAGYRWNRAKSKGIGEAYTVTGSGTAYAYYDAIPYTLHFDGAGGVSSKDSKTVYTGKSYDYEVGNLHETFPYAVREGYTFEGWYTKASGGERISPAAIYKEAGDSRIYAHWSPNTYTVYYDYELNGGTAVGKESWQEDYRAQVGYGSKVDLNVKAKKEGWIFVGWNTDPDATTALKELPMLDDDIVLYAIYKRELVITYLERTGEETLRTEERGTIYNRAEGITVMIPKMKVWDGWQALGFSLDPEGASAIDAVSGMEVPIRENVTFYGRYSQEIKVGYDTKGSEQEIPEERKSREYNASGAYQNPIFCLAEAPQRTSYSFAGWIDAKWGNSDSSDLPGAEGQSYRPGLELEIVRDTLFLAQWDEYPRLEAYDRYFTLKQAQEGSITMEMLLEKVKGSDREDGALVNGKNVTVLYYLPQDFTSFTEDGSVSVTYQATDSFGNQVIKQVMAYIVDDACKDDQRKEHIRFISSRFYKDGDDYVSPSQGGLLEDSVWKYDQEYQSALEYALANKKREESVIRTEFMGKVRKIIKPGSGKWEHEKETWTFTRDQVEDVKEFVADHGYGNAKEKEGIEMFYQMFGKCRKEG